MTSLPGPGTFNSIFDESFTGRLLANKTKPASPGLPILYHLKFDSVCTIFPGVALTYVRFAYRPRGRLWGL